MAGLYLHIPFCKRVCAYCDFYKSADLRPMKAVVEAMHDELRREATVLAARMGETLGKHVLLEGTVSPSLIGGIRVEIDGRVWDGSLRGRLEELRGLLRGAVL